LGNEYKDKVLGTLYFKGYVSPKMTK
jgi:hypothetical protein